MTFNSHLWTREAGHQYLAVGDSYDSLIYQHGDNAETSTLVSLDIDCRK